MRKWARLIEIKLKIGNVFDILYEIKLKAMKICSVDLLQLSEINKTHLF